MLQLAERRLGVAERFTPVVDDMKHYPYADDPAQLYLSVGAPYSELSEAQLGSVLGDIFTAIACSPEPAVLIVDVYGRYCPAWLPVSGERWAYSMTFFQDTVRPPTREMSFYTPRQLELLLVEALKGGLSTRLAELTFIDRSIFGSRHTATGAYNASLPQIRMILNEVLAGDKRLVPKLYIPPEAVTQTLTFQELDGKTARRLDLAITQWNQLLVRQDTPLPRLVASLEALNNNIGKSAVGVGHYLTMIAYFSANGSTRRYSRRSASLATSRPS
jgi:hypothetical protein